MSIKATIQQTGSVNATVNTDGKIVPASVTLANVSSSQVGLGNVTNESKATMFTNPVFTGTITGTLGTAAQANITSVGTLTSLDVGGNATISGDLQINGTTTTVNTTNLEVSDNIIGLNSGLTAANNKDAGLIIERGSTGNNAAFIWDESEDKFVLGTTTSTASSSGTISVTNGNLQVGKLLIGNTESSDESVFDAIISSSTNGALLIKGPNNSINLQDTVADNQFSSFADDNGVATFNSRNNTSFGAYKFKQNNGTDVVEVITIDAYHKVGIGTSSPSKKLDVNGSAQISGDLIVDTQTLKFDSTNNRVGIGTASPGTPLAVVGASTLNGTVKIPTENASFTKQRCYNKTGGIRLQKATATTDEISMRYEGANSNNFVIEQYQNNSRKGQIKFVGGQNLLRLNAPNTEVTGGLLKILGDVQVGNSNFMKKLIFQDTRLQSHGLHFRHSGISGSKIIQMGMYGSYGDTAEGLGRFVITSKIGSNSVQDVLTITGNSSNITLHKPTTINNNLSVTGNLTVNGTTTTVNQTNLDVSDNIIGLNRGAVTNANDSGIIIERGNTGPNAAFLWDESQGYFILGTTTSDASSTGAIAVASGNLYATLSKSSQPNVTSVGTLTSLAMSGTLNMGGQDITSAGNISGSTVSGSTLDGTLSTAAQPNITSVGTLTSATISGDLTIDTDTLKVDSTNNLVGIGTTSPVHPLHVSFSGDNGVEIQSTGSHSSLYVNSHSGYAQYIRFQEAGTSKYWIQSTAGKLVLRPAGTTDATKQVTFDANGDVGIGTSTPTRELEVNGRVLIERNNQIASNLDVTGPVRVTHDLFKDSGKTNKFADNSNHFHDITRINRITQQGTGDILNIERVQEKYYAIQSNILKNNKAAFWNWHRVTRDINTSSISLTNLSGWDVSGIQDSSNRQATSQALFPAGGAEATTFTFTSGNNPLAQNDLLQITIDIDFEGAIVAASLFGKVTALPTADTATVILYGGNYKSTDEVPDGNSQTAVTENFTVDKIDTSQYMALASGTGIDVLSDSTRTITTDTFSLTFASAHGLELNDVITVLTDATGGFKEAESAFVKEVTSTTEAKFVYGRLLEPAGNLALSDLSASSVVGILKGSLDGLHRETAGDILFQFNSDNVGRYKSYQIGPGTEVGADCIAIGKNVYNKDASTIKIGYDNGTLTVKSTGIDVDGDVTATTLNLSNVPVHADNTAATSAGLAVGDVYRTSTGVLMIRF